MLTLLLLIVLTIIIYFVIRQLVKQRYLIHELRKELVRLNELPETVKTDE